MKHGNLSNQVAPVVAFDVDSLLFKDEVEKHPLNPSRLWDKMRSKEEKYLDRDFNQTFVHLIRRVWENHNVSVVFVTFSFDYYPENLSRKLDHEYIPFTNLHALGKWEDARERMQSPYMYFFSSDELLLSYLSNKNARHINEIMEVLT